MDPDQAVQSSQNEETGEAALREKSISEIVGRLPGRVIKQSETTDSRTAYIVKVISNDGTSSQTNQLKVPDSNSVKPGARRVTETANNEVTSKPKRTVKTPKKLQDTDFSVNKRTPKVEIPDRNKRRTNKVLELPQVSVCQIGDNDFIVEVRVNSEFTVGPVEFIEEVNGQSKYSFTVSGKEKEDTATLFDSIVKSESFYDVDASRSESSQFESSADDIGQVLDTSHHVEVEEPEAKHEGTVVVNDDVNKSSIVKKTNLSTKRQSKKCGKDDNLLNETNVDSSKQSEGLDTEQNVDREKVKRNLKSKVKRSPLKRSRQKKTSTDKLHYTVKKSNSGNENDQRVEVSKSESNELEDSEDTCPQADDIGDELDDYANEIKNNDKTDIQTLEQSSTSIENQGAVGVSSESKKCQTIIHVKAKKRKQKPKEKNVEDELKPKRKYTKRKAYTQDNTNYSVLFNEEGGGVYKCNLCGLEIRALGNMRDHIRTHTGSRPFDCSTCGKTFSNQNNYNKHVAIHSDERPHVCHICGFAFKIKRQLKLHILRHTSKGSHVCQICGKSYHSTTELKVHLNSHGTEKNFPCDLCGKLFAHPGSMKRHRQTHTGDGQRQCHICGEVFRRRSSFRTHLIKIHNIPTENVDSLIPQGKTIIKVKRLNEDESLENDKTDENVMTVENVPFVTLDEIGGEPVYINLDETNFQIQYLDAMDNVPIVYYETTENQDVNESEAQLSNSDVMGVEGEFTGTEIQVVNQENNIIKIYGP